MLPSLPALLTLQELADLRREPLSTTRWRVYSGQIESVRVGKRARRIRRDVALASCGLTAADVESGQVLGPAVPKRPRASTAADLAA